MALTKPDVKRHHKDSGRRRPVVALPEPGLSMDQDAEWCVFRTRDGWREVRFHDYAEVYDIPGLYEHIFYEVLKCNSPVTVASLLDEEVTKGGGGMDDLRVFDLGAGNGMVGEELIKRGAKTVVGVDIIEAALRALDRDRPGLYADYLVADMTELTAEQHERLADYRFNALTCVAALGFGDIPPDAFVESFNLVEDGGWISFNIKADFLDGSDSSGFSRLIDRMIEAGSLHVRAQKRYRHRLATNGDPLYYVAIVATKHGDWDES